MVAAGVRRARRRVVMWVAWNRQRIQLAHHADRGTATATRQAGLYAREREARLVRQSKLAKGARDQVRRAVLFVAQLRVLENVARQLGDAVAVAIDRFAHPRL